jgi:hypothetical protein
MEDVKSSEFKRWLIRFPEDKWQIQRPNTEILAPPE